MRRGVCQLRKLQVFLGAPKSVRFLSSSSIATTADPSEYKKSKIYTRTGDTGTTLLYNMDRIPKTADYFDALGATDELNAHVGLAAEICGEEENDLLNYLIEIQCELMDLGSHIATPLGSSNKKQLERTALDAQSVASLEQWIDKLDAKLPPLTNFILPGGGHAACHLHIARTVARRAERSIIPLVEREDADPLAQKYLNRLSDFFFVAARYASMMEERDEMTYKKPRANKENAKEVD